MMTREEAIRFAEYAQILADGKSEVQEFYKLAETALRAQQELESNLKALESNAPLTGWISVKDRVPENYIPVLCYIPSLASQMRQTVHECHIGADGEWHSATAPAYKEEVTHWMPLPEPPEVK